MKNIKLGTKITGITLIILGLMVLSALYGIVTFNHIGNEIQHISQEYIPLNDSIVSIRIKILEQAHWLERAIRYAADSENKKIAMQEFKKRVNFIDNNLKKAKNISEIAVKSAHNDNEVKEFQEVYEHIEIIEKKYLTYKKYTHEMLNTINQIDMIDIEKLLTKIELEEDKLIYELENFGEHIEKITLNSAIDVKKDKDNSLKIIITLTIISVMAGLIMSFVLTKKITGSLDQVMESLVEGSEQIVSAATQVSSSSQSLAEGSSRQAAAVEETSSSLEELASMTRQNANNAKQAKRSRNEAYKSLQTANEAMRETSNAMSSIKARGEEIGHIIKSIDEIAFQTNLLALNAAVEAARAGEAGAGFAVVADEVRNLAMRAAEASKNTQLLIQKTVDEINSGSKLVEKTRDAFNITVNHNEKVSALIDEIASASSEQAQGINQITQSVSQMEDVTQQNAANAEESASASEQLNAQAEQLKRLADDLLCTGQGICTPELEQLLPDNSKRLSIGSSSTTSINPDQIIPLDDTDFKDF